jgi:lipid II:glycine glycyltransferase (peptidoglycan interpeptide bridge formation enzyme)/dTDP-4-amino-4,6-dideoxygalactose transaminase
VELKGSFSASYKINDSKIRYNKGSNTMLKNINNILPTIESDDIFFFWKNIFNRKANFELKVKKRLSTYFPNSTVLLFDSGRSALNFLVAKTLNKNTAVYLQAFTCSAVVAPFLTNQIKPIFVDIDTDTLNINYQDLLKKENKKAKAILLQYTFGLKPTQLKKIVEYSQVNKLLLIEDLAHSFSVKGAGKYLGTTGDAAVLSFGRDKVVSAISGGALIVNNKHLQEMLRIDYANLNRPNLKTTLLNLFYLHFMFIAKQLYSIKITRVLIFFFQKIGLLKKAVSQQEKLGILTSPPQKFDSFFSSILFKQLEKLDRLNKTRTEMVARYNQISGNKFEGPLLKYPLQQENRDQILSLARQKQIYLDTWYSNMVDPYGVDPKKLGYKTGNAPNAEAVAKRIINLPTLGNPDITILSPHLNQNKKPELVVSEITSEAEWNKFVKAAKYSPFFQSWQFGKVWENLGNKLYRLGVFNNNELVMATQAFVTRAKRGTFLHLRHGPVFTRFSKTAYKVLLKKIKTLAQTEGAAWIRQSPHLLSNTIYQNWFKKLGFINSPLHNQDAENCLVLDLEKSESEIKANFRKNTRNLVNRAKRDGVVIEKTTDLKKIAIFYKLYQETAKRDNFTPHSGIDEEFNEFTKSNNILLFLAKHNKQYLAGSLVVFFGNQAVYHHSGSVKSKVPVNYLLQWEIIKEAKRRGLKYYNLWGIAPENKPNHPWQGLTLFKKGFGGKQLDFMHSIDLPLSVNYWLSYVYQKLWNYFRGYN